jgi:hypothetical protein
MQVGANISAKAAQPGLIAYLCPACGGGHSDLVYPEEQEDHGKDGEGRGVSDNAKR